MIKENPEDFFQLCFQAFLVLDSFKVFLELEVSNPKEHHKLVYFQEVSGPSLELLHKVLADI